jgi:hypothetical protein
MGKLLRDDQVLNTLAAAGGEVVIYLLIRLAPIEDVSESVNEEDDGTLSRVQFPRLPLPPSPPPPPPLYRGRRLELALAGLSIPG